MQKSDWNFCRPRDSVHEPSRRTSPSQSPGRNLSNVIKASGKSILTFWNRYGTVSQNRSKFFNLAKRLTKRLMFESVNLVKRIHIMSRGSPISEMHFVKIHWQSGNSYFLFHRFKPKRKWSIDRKCRQILSMITWISHPSAEIWKDCDCFIQGDKSKMCPHMILRIVIFLFGSLIGRIQIGKRMLKL